MHLITSFLKRDFSVELCNVSINYMTNFQNSRPINPSKYKFTYLFSTTLVCYSQLLKELLKIFKIFLKQYLNICYIIRRAMSLYVIFLSKASLFMSLYLTDSDTVFDTFELGFLSHPFLQSSNVQ